MKIGAFIQLATKQCILIDFKKNIFKKELPLNSFNVMDSLRIKLKIITN